MIKLKQLLFESTVPDIFIPRRLNDRVDRYIKQYIRDGSKGKLNISYICLYLAKQIFVVSCHHVTNNFFNQFF